MKRTTFSAFLLVLGALAVPAFGHGIVDQQYPGPFTHDMGINASGGVTQEFTPTADNISAVDVFLTGDGTAPPIPLTINIRAGSVGGPVIGTSTVILPAGIAADASNPYVLHVDFASPIALTPGGLYSVQIDPDGGFYGVAASFGDAYPGGAGYQGTFTCCGIDWGFRTYSSEPEPPPTGPATKDACKNGGWATFSSPRAFKNQGDCIQFVNTGK